MKILFKLFFVILLSTFYSNLWAQEITISSVVKDKVSGKSIPFVNIGFMGTRTGTVSDSSGNFKLIIPEKHQEDSVSILAVGYKPRKLSVKQLEESQSKSVLLEKKLYELKEVSVKAKKRKETKLGINKGKSNFLISLSLTMLSAYIEPDESIKPYKIKSIAFYGSQWHDSPKLRIRIQKRDSIYNIPGEDITQKEIIVSPEITKGWLELDLTQYNINVENGGFFVTFELLSYQGEIKDVNGHKMHSDYTIGLKKMKTKQQYSLHKSSYFSNWEEWKTSLMVGAVILE